MVNGNAKEIRTSKEGLNRKARTGPWLYKIKLFMECTVKYITHLKAMLKS